METILTPKKPALTDQQIAELASQHGYDYAALKAVIVVESSGFGFSQITNKLIIQFEPLWFKRKYMDWKSHTAGQTWENNGVGNQTVEWLAFNNAYAIDQTAAMQATSIGMMQIMGFHYLALGYDSVNAMWEDAKQGEANQVAQGIKFIHTNSKMENALKNKDWPTLAYYYNGAGYRKFDYDRRLQSAYVHALASK
jgi:N-acetylmuramidase